MVTINIPDTLATIPVEMIVLTAVIAFIICWANQ